MTDFSAEWELGNDKEISIAKRFRLHPIALLFVGLALGITHETCRAAQPDSVTIGNSSFSEDYVPLWLGVEGRLAVQ
ncbi:MAG: hypothetical protein FJ145_16675 [Deltaproteobacteria bacterium]|nr:hypothetical protein [Deltaproteobacteria bacterium]